MYRWKSNKGYPIYWFSKDNYAYNNRKSSKESYTCVCFGQYCIDWRGITNWNGYIIGEDFNILDYAANFVDELPENPVLYFDESSNFPRTKLKAANYKRTLDAKKANAIVLGQSAEVKCIDIIYHIFTDSTEIFSISNDCFHEYFYGDWEILESNKKLGLTFQGHLKPIYSGTIKVVFDKTETLKMFNDGFYSKPFILDTSLDNIVNQELPDPDLQSLIAIREMLNSPDSTTIKLGASLAAGFNVSKWPLTFRTLLELDLSWTKAMNGGNAVVIKQMQNTLKIGPYSYYGGWWVLANHIQALKEDYSEEDIRLAQDFARTIPDIKKFCESRQSFYLDCLPFVPDEYKH